MTIGELIKNKDYDYVSYRLTLRDGSDTFAGCFASKDGEIIPLDGDIYDKDEEVLSYREWSKPEDDINNGLTIVVKGELISDDFNLGEMTNEELDQQLYHEVLYYSEDLLKLCRLIRKNIPRKMMYRLISKLYRVRTKI